MYNCLGIVEETIETNYIGLMQLVHIQSCDKWSMHTYMYDYSLIAMYGLDYTFKSATIRGMALIAFLPNL